MLRLYATSFVQNTVGEVVSPDNALGVLGGVYTGNTSGSWTASWAMEKPPSDAIFKYSIGGVFRASATVECPPVVMPPKVKCGDKVYETQFMNTDAGVYDFLPLTSTEPRTLSCKIIPKFTRKDFLAADLANTALSTVIPAGSIGGHNWSPDGRFLFLPMQIDGVYTAVFVEFNEATKEFTNVPIASPVHLVGSQFDYFSWIPWMSHTGIFTGRRDDVLRAHQIFQYDGNNNQFVELPQLTTTPLYAAWAGVHYDTDNRLAYIRRRQHSLSQPIYVADLFDYPATAPVPISTRTLASFTAAAAFHEIIITNDAKYLVNIQYNSTNSTVTYRLYDLASGTLLDTYVLPEYYSTGTYNSETWDSAWHKDKFGRRVIRSTYSSGGIGTVLIDPETSKIVPLLDYTMTKTSELGTKLRNRLLQFTYGQSMLTGSGWSDQIFYWASNEQQRNQLDPTLLFGYVGKRWYSSFSPRMSDAQQTAIFRNYEGKMRYLGLRHFDVRDATNGASYAGLNNLYPLFHPNNRHFIMLGPREVDPQTHLSLYSFDVPDLENQDFEVIVETHDKVPNFTKIILTSQVSLYFSSTASARSITKLLFCKDKKLAFYQVGNSSFTSQYERTAGYLGVMSWEDSDTLAFPNNAFTDWYAASAAGDFTAPTINDINGCILDMQESPTGGIIAIAGKVLANGEATSAYQRLAFLKPYETPRRFNKYLWRVLYPGESIGTLSDVENVGIAVSWHPTQDILAFVEAASSLKLVSGVIAGNPVLGDAVPSLSGITGAKWTPDGTYLVVYFSVAPRIRFFELVGGELVLANPQPSITLPTSTVLSLDMSEDGSLMACTSLSTPFIHIYSYDSQSDTFTKFANPSVGVGGRCEQVAVEKTGRYVITARTRESTKGVRGVFVYDCSTGVAVDTGNPDVDDHDPLASAAATRTSLVGVCYSSKWNVYVAAGDMEVARADFWHMYTLNNYDACTGSASAQVGALYGGDDIPVPSYSPPVLQEAEIQGSTKALLSWQWEE